MRDNDYTENDASRRSRLATWARTLLERRPLILDTETTGLDGYFVQVAVIDSDGAVLLQMARA